MFISVRQRRLVDSAKVIAPCVLRVMRLAVPRYGASKRWRQTMSKHGTTEVLPPRITARCFA